AARGVEMAAASAGAAPEDDEAFLSVEGVSKVFDNAITAVDDIDLVVRKGEIFALLGSSGCGKSTLLRMLAGFETPTRGRVRLAGQDITELPPYRRPINMMFQSYALFPHLDVWDNIAFGLRREALPKAEVAARVERQLKLVRLEKYARRKPHQLSGGQQQRVALARSLAKEPQLLLLDEPLGALDRKLREETQIELVNIIEHVGVTCVLVTHDQEEAMSMATRIAVMNEGRFLQVGTPSDVYETPNCRFVADFIGSVNLFEGEVVVDDADHVVVRSPDCSIYVGHGITGTLGMAVGVALRPEKIHLSHHQPAGDFNWVHGEVVEMAYFGDATTFHVKLPSGLRVKVARMNHLRHGAEGYTWGDRIFLHWNDDAMVVVTQ
ncbi:MAG TPA: polyamine ABC transporter ATP-binding protein, partial [Rhodocyclaceae bacterium]|nr:polyamine ABC transporter ATP-binding protein [Rhodocyclaceae bacterium]